ncbi:GNAT family N-acetyltransferase [Candidatus Epulonipiscium fishelsonii]|uniref:GNAT family N-acetyltransferase n=1 Tax=Candidatus Epulonipiscium fishelsonii TaxID=77094 RepID=A0ACC8XG96_9FIRM|nr:GNAT family N-acetyltransferase [Epulopiscium sp. SCG-B11WGA-EpuloA1]
MIRSILSNKKQYLDLLLLGDEQESMIDKYLDRGELFGIFSCDGEIKAICVVTDEGNNIIELKNIAVVPQYQRQGLGKMLIDFLIKQYSSKFLIMRVGTGDSPITISFYRQCGFKEVFRVKNFFIDNYDEPIFEAGQQLIDMVYLELIF